jgi:hypothetical protein
MSEGGWKGGGVRNAQTVGYHSVSNKENKWLLLLLLLAVH